jgi:predicted  nucleic acid-binding Zn-ribbon protein
MLQVCTKCGKVNMLTRKYCMNCGASLIAYGRKQESSKRYSVPSPMRIIRGKSPAEEDIKPWDSFRISTDDNFVKPSEIKRDRIISVSPHRTMESELDKARQAFERADAVGIDESGTGVIETRMLRASEVQELLSDWGPEPEITESSSAVEHVPQSAPAIHSTESTREEMEQHFLGSQSALTKHGYSEKQKVEPVTQIERPSEDFSSTLYRTGPTEPVPETKTLERAERKTVRSEIKSNVELPSDSIDVSTDSTPWVVICPDCGKVMHSDLYEYPAEVYIQMGNARLKQAKYLFIQGKPDEALKAAKLSRMFFEKENDERGLIQLARLERLLGPSV